MKVRRGVVFLQFARRKAAELEMFHCPGQGAITEGGREEEEEKGGPAAKRRCEEGEGGEAEEGEILIRGFLGAVRDLPLGSMSGADVRSRLEGMKEELLAKKNSFVASLLEQLQ